jgi:hypothetical protein
LICRQNGTVARRCKAWSGLAAGYADMDSSAAGYAGMDSSSEGTWVAIVLCALILAGLRLAPGRNACFYAAMHNMELC